MGLSTAQRAVVAVAVGFAIPVISWAVPGERGPDTLAGALLHGLVIAVVVFGLQSVRQGARKGAFEAGRRLRDERQRERTD
jgi:hypothetical protein